LDVLEELAGRELYYIIKSSGLWDDKTAINQLCEPSSVAGIKCGNIITYIVIIGLSQETHLEEGGSK
jgi:hypothetical protein